MNDPRYSNNPDLRELAHYNEMAKQAECEHVNLRRIYGDDNSWLLCKDCGKAHPDPKRQPNGCKCNWDNPLTRGYPPRECKLHYVHPSY